MAREPLILKELAQSPALQSLEQFAKVESSLLVEELWDAPKALLILLLLRATKKNILVVSSGQEDRLYQDLQTLATATVLEFPSWETLPEEEISPSSDIVGKRFETLFSLLNQKNPSILLCPLQACLQKLPSPTILKPLCHHWKVGDEIPFAQLAETLDQLGYRRSPLVSDKGEYALRGGILDLFPVSSFDPYRIDFFGDAIEQIRTFDPVSQKSIEKVKSLFLSPASELNLLKQDPATLFDYLGQETLVIFNNLLELEDRYVAIKTMLGGSRARTSFKCEVGPRQSPGIEIVREGGSIEAIHPPSPTTQSRELSRRSNLAFEACPSTSRYFITLDTLFNQCGSLPTHYWADHPIEELSSVHIAKKTGRQFYSGKDPLQPLNFSILDQKIATKRWQHPFRRVEEFFSLSETQAASSGSEILQGISHFAKSHLQLHFLCATEAEEQALQQRIAQENITLPKATHFDPGYLSSGFVVTDSQIAYVPNTDLTHRYQPRRQKWRSTHHTPASEFHELCVGDVVVHFHNGIAKYLGTEKRPNNTGQMTEFMVLEYSEKSRLFVPVSQSHLVSRYIGVKEEIPTLSTLGSARWQKTRLQAQQAIIGYADQLLRLTAARELHGGFNFGPDSKEMHLFEADFPFVETEDQLQAIEGIKKDMASAKAMDRLICGDVGYGKTEVAMRAAFKAVADGKKQVAVLVPTTVLAMQHYETFCDRMANFPVTIGVVSRFCSAKEIKETLKKTEEGKIDILIGTHRIISRDVRFKELGLIIIDEEQRFGVRAKEHLKTLKTGVDCITLSATPIPRTLYLSLVGARDISVINTPPQDRLPIKSIIAEKESGLIQNALLRELSRDGQAYLIHNRVESIFQFSEEIQKLVPQARIVVGHGQMSADELDIVFHAFKSGEADILIATTIIENGIDIPNANTILIDRADTFGLADLYQMRGRVGRWNRPAYAYLLVPHQRELPELSRKRLQALVEASGYGGGMKIAMRDLEIRGAGDILGTQQSGQICTVGFHLYCKLLKKAIEALRNKSSPSFTETKMEFSYPASLPEGYINESSLRMEIYHRLGEAATLKEIDAILAELKDRFGPFPNEVLWLYHLSRLRLLASQNHFTLLKFENLTFTAERQEKATTIKKTLPLPRTKNPSEWEGQVIEQLSQAFSKFSRSHPSQCCDGKHL